MTPIVDRLETQYGDRVAFKQINAAEGDGPAIMRGYRVSGHPTTLIFDDQGQEVHRILGPQPAETVEAVLQQLLGD